MRRQSGGDRTSRQIDCDEQVTGEHDPAAVIATGSIGCTGSNLDETDPCEQKRRLTDGVLGAALEIRAGKSIGIVAYRST